MIKIVDRDTCRLLRVELETVLGPLAAKHGIAITVKSGRFSPQQVIFSVECATKSEGGVVNTREATAFKLNADLYQLKPTDLHRTFTHAGRQYEIIGLLTKSHRFPILCEGEGGRQIKFPADTIRALLK